MSILSVDKSFLNNWNCTKEQMLIRSPIIEKLFCKLYIEKNVKTKLLRLLDKYCSD